MIAPRTGLGEMLPGAATEEAVLAAVELLCVADGFAPTIDEIRARLLDNEIDVAAGGLHDILRSLVGRQALEFHVHRERERFWPPGYGGVGAQRSRRQLVAAVASNTVMALARAVRASEVAAFAAEHYPELWAEESLSAIVIQQDLSSLVQTGEFIVVEIVRGGTTGGGGNLYLPASLADRRDELDEREALNWTDYVAGRFTRLWAERAAQAGAAGVRPTALTTDEIRKDLVRDLGPTGTPVAEAKWNIDLGDPQMVINVLAALSRGGKPVTRRAPGRSAAWIPAGVPDDAVALSSSFAKDADRVVEALRRAQARTGRPAVRAKEVAAEADHDDSLRLAGRSSVATYLSDLSKKAVAGTNGMRVQRRQQRVVRVGVLRGAAMYTAPSQQAVAEDVQRALLFVQTEGLVDEAADLDLAGQYEAADLGSMVEIVVGRLRLAHFLADDLARRINAALAEPGGTPPAEAMLHGLLEETQALRDRWEARERFRAGRLALPRDVRPYGQLLTALELRDLLAPITSSVGGHETLAATVVRFAEKIRRVRNPSFRARTDSDSRAASEYLFDRTDALWYAARTWAGYRARVAAQVAATELGLLRDARFVIATLRTADSVGRIRAVQSLAFLDGDDVLDELRRRATADVDAGVRQTALWAYGVAGGADAMELIAAAASDDEHPVVRKAAAAILRLGAHGWWRV